MIVKDCVYEYGELTVVFIARVNLYPIDIDPIELEILAFATRTPMGDSAIAESNLIIMQGFMTIAIMLFMTFLDISLGRPYIHPSIPRR